MLFQFSGVHLVVRNGNAKRSIPGLQPRDKATLLGVNKTNLYPKNLHENGFKFQEKRNAFVLDSQHGQRDVTCKLAVVS